MENMTKRTKIGCGVGAFIAVVVLIGGLITIFSIHRVDPGTYAILVRYSSTGQTTHQVLAAGTQINIWPWENVRLQEYNSATQTLKMVRANGEGLVSGPDDTHCQDKNGVPLSLDSSIFWNVSQDNAYTVYSQHPGVDLTNSNGPDNNIAGLVVRPAVQAAIIKECSKRTYLQILDDRSTMAEDIASDVLQNLANTGTTIKNIFLGQAYLDPSLQQQITQVAQAQAELQVSVTKIQIAKNEALAAIEKAKGQAAALDILRKEIAQDPNLIQIYWIDKWDGHSMVVTDGKNTVTVQVPSK